MVRSTLTLPSLGEEQFCIPAGLVKDHQSTSSVVVAESILPLPLKILEKIHKWEYVDLTTLLSSNHAGETPASLMVSVNGQTLIVNLSDHQSKKRKVTLDIHSWTQTRISWSSGSHVQCTTTGKRPGGQPVVGV